MHDEIESYCVKFFSIRLFIIPRKYMSESINMRDSLLD